MRKAKQAICFDLLDTLVEFYVKGRYVTTKSLELIRDKKGKLDLDKEIRLIEKGVIVPHFTYGAGAVLKEAAECGYDPIVISTGIELDYIIEKASVNEIDIPKLIKKTISFTELGFNKKNSKDWEKALEIAEYEKAVADFDDDKPALENAIKGLGCYGFLIDRDMNEPLIKESGKIIYQGQLIDAMFSKSD